MMLVMMFIIVLICIIIAALAIAVLSRYVVSGMSDLYSIPKGLVPAFALNIEECCLELWSTVT